VTVSGRNLKVCHRDFAPDQLLKWSQLVNLPID
jgi:hypothetical protein